MVVGRRPGSSAVPGRVVTRLREILVEPATFGRRQSRMLSRRNLLPTGALTAGLAVVVTATARGSN